MSNYKDHAMREFRAENARYEKFAELILKEAMAIVRDEVSFLSDWDCADNAITKVNEHFGVDDER